MREILFRGKRVIDGKWVESCCPLGEMQSGTVTYDFVSETVCQYTGLTDKNGRKIFEGDIVRYIDEVIGKEKVDEVEYNETHAAFCRLHKSKMGLQYLFIDEAVANKCEVCGNIFDNPEFIGE